MFKKIIDKVRRIKKETDVSETVTGSTYEYCPNCNGNLTLQKGYRNTLSYWICRGCGEMLINPDVDTDSNIVWICDHCGTMLNIQEGFSEQCGEWKCTICGTVGKIKACNVFTSEEEYQGSLRDPYRGLTNDEVLALSHYQHIEYLSGRKDIILVKNRTTDTVYVKKILTTYNRSVYDYLLSHPIKYIPRIEALYEGSNCLIVIEEYVPGRTVDEILKDRLLSEDEALRILKNICGILKNMYSLPTPMIHRDIKPSNIIISNKGEVYLLDMNVAKWYDPGKTDDTRHLGTPCFAAPEQTGYGLFASSLQTDVYSIGILFNVMLTGKIPKEKRAAGRSWDIIERCIRLEPEERFTIDELVSRLDEMEKMNRNAEEVNGRTGQGT